MCRESGNYTDIARSLLDVGKFKTHGKPINAEEAMRIGITVERLAATDPFWDACWRLYCLLRLRVKEGEKLFESELVSVTSDSAP
jgi:hypothetical protein